MKTIMTKYYGQNFVFAFDTIIYISLVISLTNSDQLFTSVLHYKSDTSKVSTTTSKFGLAWLFSTSNNSSKKSAGTSLNAEDGSDRRASGLILTLTAIRGDRNIVVKDPETDRNYPEGSLENEASPAACITNSEEVGQSRMPAREQEDLFMKCKLENVHYQVDMENFYIEWIRLKKNTVIKDKDRNKNKTDDKNCIKSRESEIILSSVIPECRLCTKFPVIDLQTSTKNITCTSTFVIPSLTTNDTGVYMCRSSLKFKVDEGTHQGYSFSREKSNGNIFPTPKYVLETTFHLRVSRLDNYNIHALLSIMITCFLALIIIVLLAKKVLRHKMSWESKSEPYMPSTWQGGIPTRRIASSGSLYQSRITLRRPSEPGIAEVDESDFSENEDTTECHKKVPFYLPSVIETTETTQENQETTIINENA